MKAIDRSPADDDVQTSADHGIEISISDVRKPFRHQRTTFGKLVYVKTEPPRVIGQDNVVDLSDKGMFDVWIDHPSKMLVATHKFFDHELHRQVIAVNNVATEDLSAGLVAAMILEEASTLAGWLRGRYARSEVLDVADPELPKRILAALEDSSTDFRTVSSLADEFGVTEDVIRRELNDLGEKVRRPLGQEARYPDWYRLQAKGPTRQEKWSRWKAVLSFSTMDDDF